MRVLIGCLRALPSQISTSILWLVGTAVEDRAHCGDKLRGVGWLVVLVEDRAYCGNKLRGVGWLEGPVEDRAHCGYKLRGVGWLEGLVEDRAHCGDKLRGGGWSAHGRNVATDVVLCCKCCVKLHQSWVLLKCVRSAVVDSSQ